MYYPQFQSKLRNVSYFVGKDAEVVFECSTSNSFPQSFDDFIHKIENWIPNYDPETAIASKILDLFILAEIMAFIFLPLTTPLYFVFSPNVAIHPRHLLPPNLKNNILLNLLIYLWITQVTAISWYIMEIFSVFATLYFCKWTINY
jgi:hypothetical protein